MTSFVALVHAVNVGGTSKLAMADLKRVCEAAGLGHVRTYIASGNVVFISERGAHDIRTDLEMRLRNHGGKHMAVAIRTAAEMADVLTQNPFPDAPGNRVVAIFLNEPVSAVTLDGITGRAADEEVRLGTQEIYVRYGQGMARSKLRIAAAKAGTARNMNTIAKLAAMAAN